jgi:hypothetical protein
MSTKVRTEVEIAKQSIKVDAANRVVELKYFGKRYAPVYERDTLVGLDINDRRVSITTDATATGGIGDHVFIRDADGVLIDVVKTELLGLTSPSGSEYLKIAPETQFTVADATAMLLPVKPNRCSETPRPAITQSKGAIYAEITSAQCLDGCDKDLKMDEAFCDFVFDAHLAGAGVVTAGSCATVVGCVPGAVAGGTIAISGAATRYFCRRDAINKWASCRANCS